MAQPDEPRFRPKPGKARGRGDVGAKRFTSQVLRAGQKAAGGAGGPLRRGPSRGAEKGRGHVAAKVLGDRIGARSRRVVVKARLVVHSRAAAGSTGAHLRYIQRDGTTPDGKPGQAYSADRDVVDTGGFEARVQGDRHAFRFIFSPEDAAEIGDLKGFTRDLMGRMEADIGSKLDWVAVDHWDTDNPHTHVLLRGVDDAGRDLVIARDYIAHGLRLRASALATDLLGPQTERERRDRMTREVDHERWTGLDQQLAERSLDGVVDLRAEPSDGDRQFRRGLLIGRAQTLERLGLAEPEGPGRWALSPNAETTLRAMGERGDIIRRMQRSLGSTERPMVVFDASDGTARSIVGRVAGKGLSDELHDRGYLVVDGLDGRAHHVALPAGGDLTAYPLGGVVEVRATPHEPRPADRTIAAQVGNDGLYRPDRHLAELRRVSGLGDDPEAYVAAHVRRLEALRRTGLVKRLDASTWRVPTDYLDRAARYEAERSGGALIELRSHLSVGRQARALGATWLDRALIDGAMPAPTGFGADVRSALDERRAFLVEEGLANRRGQRLVLARDLLNTLRDRDVAQAGRALSAETGLEHRPMQDGAGVRGVYRRSVTLASGRFAMVDDDMGFSLVPWKPVMEQRLGQEIVGVMRGGSVSWDLSRRRGIGV